MKGILGQSNPGATILTACYTVPAGKETVLSTIGVCNRDPGATSWRLSCARGGAVDSSEQYLYYDLPIEGHDSFMATIGITLSAGDVVRVYAALATLSFNLFGIEVDA